MNDSEKFKAFLLGLLAGGLTATVLSLLYAPVSGKKLRKKISDKAEGLFEGAARRQHCPDFPLQYDDSTVLHYDTLREEY